MDRLSNTVRPYAWGSTTAIPALLGTAPTGEPQAEMWMGAHPGGPSRIDRGAGEQTLSAVIEAAPEAELGEAAVRKFGPRLPFLLKILAAGAPLSLQVHPDLAQAKEGYAAEESAGVPVDAPHRNYKDANHKPELICALTPFEGLCGFRAPAESADVLAGLDVDSLKPYVDLLHAHPEEAALREILTAVLAADRAEMAETVTSAAAAAARLGGAYAPYAVLAHHYPGDPGVIAAMLLNYVRLQPGEALFLGAGVPHAYLGGLGVEIMANSDNVLRCGLTPKHVDVPELLRIVRFEARDPGILRPEASSSTGEELYDTPIDEFRLSRYVLAPGAAPRTLPSATPQILLCTAGEVRAGETTLTPGQSVFVPAGESAQLSGTGTLFRATVVA
ncbi:mannose-6-phosphate isomerase, class I [Streptomyces agglomeratus]|uniref:Mannose-6-phosphate isomerase n=1 Tax=Streptomyces agglomeratus TaxID=285458 RepID=A0A1E5PAR0_9ACTN|nr:mannose-6-phosphate isomerase, class I [Streptomyces agglomeratus]OEJ26608.1 mannose-6-phosphate isomerase, class I [Streptomyces agglomeratus]OEJ39324.1 mannose-6-phosphate isomerase, class I [Streptomyces agglomeratus]OEJ46292.1 mannose-6-phosphate isomerase, class I [Streptomyces agglomeratus]OEJ51843.1 mannose-6-phosphate isomerase, class I [Streptomyces agglomeratus]OEJ59251.1 mannose-6-phosphate isomerase, class I [Streptomyces agglomeratus]